MNKNLISNVQDDFCTDELRDIANTLEGNLKDIFNNVSKIEIYSDSVEFSIDIYFANKLPLSAVKDWFENKSYDIEIYRSKMSILNSISKIEFRIILKR